MRPEAQGQALERRLLQEVVEIAMREGYERIRLDTLPTMIAAQRLYAQLGFEKTNAYYESPVKGMLFMALELAPLQRSGQGINTR